MTQPSDLPPLPHVALSSIAHPLTAPVPRIRTDVDVERWKSMPSWSNYLLFLSRLNQAVMGADMESAGQPSKAILKMHVLLMTLDKWIDEIPPLPTPQRFGNLAFRDWGKRLEERGPSLLDALLPPELRPATLLLAPYLLTSFGSFTRMDYGTGHELSFGLLLLSMTLIRVFEPSPSEERELVLRVFEKYLRLVWRLQDVYKLEPAGSHGVWGLDDYQFLPYLWGSAQLLKPYTSTPAAVLHTPLPPTNLYYLSIMRVQELKSGPFHEHSPQLHSIASSVPNWGKVNKGLFKMYEAEVLGKRVVVQHVPFGGILAWQGGEADVHPAASPTSDDGESVEEEMATRAPWAQSASAKQTVPAATFPLSWSSSATRDINRNSPAVSLSSQAQTQAPWSTGASAWPSSSASGNLLPPPRISSNAPSGVRGSTSSLSGATAATAVDLVSDPSEPSTSEKADGAQETS